MGLFRTFCLFYLCLTFAESAPKIKQPTMYDAILQKCPSLNPTFKEHTLFTQCNNWDRINSTQNLTETTKDDVLCLLFFHSFTQYCNRTKEPTIDLTKINMTIQMGDICDNLTLIPNQTEPDAALRKIITTKEDCKKLCASLVLVMPMCSISYYFSHVPAAPSNNYLIPVPKTVDQTKTTNQTTTVENYVLNQEHNSDVERKNNFVESTTLKTKIDEESAPKQNAAVVQTVNTNNNVGDVEETQPVQTVRTNVVSDVSTENKKPHSTQKVEEVANQKMEEIVKQKVEEVERQKNPPVINSPPKNDVPAVDNNQMEKNQDKDFEDGGDDIVNEESPQQINDRLESEEELEEPSSPVEKSPKPMQIDETEAANFASEMDGDSYFFTYFMVLCVIFVVGYVCYHNKQKILALMLEGRRGRRQYRGRRPNSANYHKLDSNLEEAITSSCNKNTNNVIY